MSFSPAIETGVRCDAVTKPVPYRVLAADKLQLLDQSTQVQMFLAYQRWLLTRAHIGAAGFSGYWVGSNLDQSEILGEIDEIGRRQLEAIARLHKGDGFIGKMWAVLEGRSNNLDVLAELHACFGAILGRLRMRVDPRANREGSLYRASMSQLAQILPRMILGQGDSGMIESATFRVPSAQSDQYILLHPSSDPLRFMDLIGKVGHPVVRVALRMPRF